MTLYQHHARILAALLIAAATAGSSAAQQPSQPPSSAAPTPAPPSVPAARKVPKPAQATPATVDGIPAVPPHLTVARPVAKPATSSSPTAAPQSTAPSPKPKPAPTPTPSSTPATPTTATVSINRTIVVLDPAHGGADIGSRISDQVTEKDVDLALAFHIRSLLTARGFTVVMTRESDEAFATPEKAATSTAAGVPGVPLTLDDRAGIANHAHPAACLLLHATGVGSGVHLYGSELSPAPAEPVLVPWLKAQAAWVPQSQRLEAQLATALGRARIAFVQSNASVRPVDSLTCPGLVIELAPESAGKAASLLDDSYLGRVADAIAGTLVAWQNQVQPPQHLLPAPPPPPAPSTAAAPITGEVQP